MDCELAVLWLTHFEKHTAKKANGHARLLVVDGHNSHYSFEFLDYARSHKIHVLCYPAHTTHVYQGLDVVVFSVLKQCWAEERTKWEAGGGEVLKETFLTIYGAAHIQTLSPVLVKKAFEKTSIWPFNPNIIPAEMMAPSKETSRKGHLPFTLSTSIRIAAQQLKCMLLQPTETTYLTNPINSMDLTNPTNSMNMMNATNTLNATNVTNTMGATNVVNAMDVAGVANTVDVADVMNTVDAVDVTNTVDVVDVTNTVDAADTTNAMRATGMVNTTGTASMTSTANMTNSINLMNATNVTNSTDSMNLTNPTNLTTAGIIGNVAAVVDSAIHQLQDPAVGYLTRSSPIKPTAQLPPIPTTMLSPIKQRLPNHLQHNTTTLLERVLMEKLQEATIKEAYLKGKIAGLQSTVILQDAYLHRVQGQLEAREGKKNKGGGVLNDGHARLLTKDEFIEKVAEKDKQKALKQARKEQRKAIMAEYKVALDEWKKTEEERKQWNVNWRLEWKREVEEWIQLKGKGRGKKPLLGEKKAIPKPV